MAKKKPKFDQLQQAAYLDLVLALEACRDAGLTGGVFSRHFCLWPIGQHPQTAKDFFAEVERIGKVFDIDGMMLDGGAGV